MTRRIVVDALQVPSQLTGVGRQVQAIGAALADAPPEIELELRCTAEAVALLAPSFPARTDVRAVLRRSTPRLRRIVHQQLVAPFLERPGTVLVCPGDQAPLFGRTRRLLVGNDVHRLTGPGSSPTLEALWYRLIVPAAARRAHRVLTVSRFSAGAIRDALGIDAVVVAAHPPPAVEVALPGGGGFTLVVGALRAYKGIETAVEGARLAGLPLVLAGPDEGRASALRAEGVEVTGWVPEERLDALYRDAAVVVAPSTYEGYGLPVAESLARGRPTVASDIPPHRELGGEAVLYFPPGDADALAGRLREAVARPAELAAAALDRSRELAAQRPGWAEAILAAAQ